jgi:hypothetical protein
MPTFQDFARFQINLESTPAIAVKSTIPMLMVDHDDVPIHTRIRAVTPATKLTVLTTATEQYNWFTRFWGQRFPTNAENSRKNVKGYIGRWVSADSKPYRIFPNAEDDYTVYLALLATSKFKITDTTTPTPVTEDIAVDFTADADMDDVAASITAGFGNSTYFPAYTCSINVLGELCIFGGATGSAALSFTLSAPDSGIDLTTTLSNSTSYFQAGLDAETLGASTIAAFDADNTPSVVFQRGADDTGKLAWLTAMDAVYWKFAVVTSSSTDHENSVKTDTLGYLSNDAENGNCHVIYSRQSDSKPYRVFPNAEDDYTVYTALTNTSKFKITDTTTPTPVTEDIAVDFTADADMNDVAAGITAGFGNSTYFSAYTCSVNVLGELCIFGGATGDDPSFTLSAPDSGVDLTTTLSNSTSYFQKELDDYIDAAAYGENLPQDEGTVDYAINPLEDVYPSGMEADGVTPAEVSDAAVEALDAVNCDFVTKPDVNLSHTFLARGLCPNGDEVRIVLAKNWCEYNVSREVYLYMVSRKVVTFSDLDIAAFVGIAQRYLDVLVERRCINAGYQLNIPSASDFTAAQRASHYMSISEVAAATIQFAVNQVFMSATFSA